jgi:hypothetical protein
LEWDYSFTKDMQKGGINNVIESYLEGGGANRQ